MGHGSQDYVSLIDLKKENAMLIAKIKVMENILSGITNSLVEAIATQRALITVLEAENVVNPAMIDQFAGEQKDRLIDELVSGPALKKEERASLTKK